MAVNLAASTILTAKCCAVNRWVQRLITLHEPLKFNLMTKNYWENDKI